MRILHFIYGLHIGGAESFIRNLMTALQGIEKYQFYFAIQDSSVTNEYFKKILNSTSEQRFFILPSFPVNIYGQIKALNQLLIEHKFDAIHIHMNSYVNPIPIIVAKIRQIPIIVHSHNTQNAAGGRIGKTLHLLNRKLFNYDAINRLACGEEAGTWMFKNRKFTIIHNSIDLHKFCFDSQIRIKTRESLGIPYTTHVIAMVGRLHPQKNHKRALEIFRNYNHKHPDSKLLIVGDGPLKNTLLSYADKLSISNNSIFVGANENVHQFYCASDVLLFPSLYEGLAIVGIEAQATGLKIVASDNVPQEMDITNRVEFLSLSESDEYWTDHLFKNIVSDTTESRVEIMNRLKSCPYSLESLASSMSSIYNNINKN